MEKKKRTITYEERDAKIDKQGRGRRKQDLLVYYVFGVGDE